MEALALRHHLHQHPELSGEERATQDLIYNLLRDLKPHSLERIGGTSVIAQFDSKQPGDHILFRADYDALPIQENLDLPYQSTKAGVSHKCGHDGHTAILYQLAQQVASNTPKKGKLSLLFQASEENGKGAAKVLEDPRFKAYDYQYAYALHNIPAYPLGQVLYREGNFSAGVSSISFEWKGLETHAAHPWEGRNPASLLAELINESQAMENQDMQADDFFLCTPVYAHLGETNYGISAAQGGVHFTARAWRATLLKQNLQALIEASQKKSKAQSIQLQVDRFEEFWPIVNSAKANQKIILAAQLVQATSLKLERPFSWGEDFGLLIKDKAGAMFGLGAGEECKVLHHPDYNFPDALIAKGAAIFYQIYLQHLHD